MIMLSVMISFVSAMGGNVVNSYDPAIVKEWLNSYPYLYKGFTPNKGQLATMDGKIAENVIFYSRNGNMGIFITENGLSYVIYGIEKEEAKKDKEILPHIEERLENFILHYARIDYELIGGKIKKENIIYQDELPGYENFYLAHCPDGILFVKSYRKVIIKDIYPGINWIFRYDDNGNFHHEFEIKNPQLISQIKLKVKYADIELADNGKSIILSTPIGKIKDGSLIGYQGNNLVEVNYRLIDNNLIAFDIKNFDKDKSLLIDPHALIWSTYYGGSDPDYSYSITTDANGNVFVTGYTQSSDFPTQDPGSGAYYDNTCGGCPNPDGFILKFSNSGVRLWATYYGGSGGENFYSITTDANGNVFVTGYTSSTDFPTYNPGGAYYDNTLGGVGDAFILKFDNNGVRLWATYYGGSDPDYSYSITTDANGNVFVTGYTQSSDFPTQDPGSGAYYDNTCGGCPNPDGFILKFTNSGSLIWSTYYGGSSSDNGYSIATDANGNVFVTGITWSTDFLTQDPGSGAYFDNTLNGSYDAFILKFTNSGELKWATYYGGSDLDIGNSITTDANGNVFVTGITSSTDFPTQNPGGGAYYQGACSDCPNTNDAFILKFTNSGVRLWATYYGGNDYDYGRSITTDANGNVFVTGYTYSTNFPTYNPGGGAYYQSSNAGSGDAFISKFSSSSSVSERNNYYYYRDKLTLNLKSLSTPITIKIYSLDGKLIYSNIFKTNSIEINLKSLKPGIYILKAYSKDNKQLTYKFIKS